MPGRVRTVEFMVSVSCRVTLAITGGIGQRAGGALAKTVRVDGVVGHHSIRPRFLASSSLGVIAMAVAIFLNPNRS